jgi:hypothetical protein
MLGIRILPSVAFLRVRLRPFACRLAGLAPVRFTFSSRRSSRRRVRRVARRWRSFAFASSDERPSLCPCRCFMGVSLTSRSRPAAQDWGGGGAWRAAPPAWPNPGTMLAHPQQRPHFPAQLRTGGWQRAEPSIAGPQTLPLRLSPRPPVRPGGFHPSRLDRAHNSAAMRLDVPPPSDGTMLRGALLPAARTTLPFAALAQLRCSPRRMTKGHQTRA